MKITIYELIGLVKDGKAPKKIKFNYSIYEYKWSNAYQEKCYVNGNNYRLWENLNLNSNLNDEVEIIVEPKKIKNIKSNGDEFYSDYIDTWISKNKTDAYCEFLMNKINELIDEINNLKEK
jgi:hypothetical protein